MFDKKIVISFLIFLVPNTPKDGALAGAHAHFTPVQSVWKPMPLSLIGSLSLSLSLSLGNVAESLSACQPPPPQTSSAVANETPTSSPRASSASHFLCLLRQSQFPLCSFPSTLLFDLPLLNLTKYFLLCTFTTSNFSLLPRLSWFRLLKKQLLKEATISSKESQQLFLRLIVVVVVLSSILSVFLTFLYHHHHHHYYQCLDGDKRKLCFPFSSAQLSTLYNFHSTDK